MHCIRYFFCCIALCLNCSLELHAQAHVTSIAHRGGRSLAPENTLAAVSAGMASKADFVEIDVHQTMDSVVVVSHDETLDRCTDGQGRIDKTTFAAIRKSSAFIWDRTNHAELMMSNVLLKVEQLNAWYDHSHVVQGLNFEVKQGEIVTLMGRNGAG